MSTTPIRSPSEDLDSVVRAALVDFFGRLEHPPPTLRANTNLITGTEATSDEGVEFAIELSDVLGTEVPHDFNPFLHESGRRGRTFAELMDAARRFQANAKESCDGE